MHPHEIGIYLELSVNKYVSHPGNLRLWNLRGEGANLFRDCPGRFSDDLEMAHEPRLQQFIAFDRLLFASGVAFNRLDSLHDVAETLDWVSQTGMASRSTRARIRALRPFSVTTSTGRPRAV